MRISIPLLIIFISSFSSLIFSNDTAYDDLNPLLKEIFTVNIGVMSSRSYGRVGDVSPVLRRDIDNTIHNTLEELRFIALTPKSSLIKAYKVFLSKRGSNATFQQKSVEEILSLTDERRSSNLVKMVFDEFFMDTQFSPISMNWFELYDSDIYKPSITIPFQRDLRQISEICNTRTPPVDLLFYSEVERLGTGVFVTVKVYNNLEKKDIYSFSFISQTDNINLTTAENLRANLRYIFGINYGSINITADEDVQIYLNNKYEGKGNLLIEHLKPGSYTLEYRRENYDNVVIPIVLAENEDLRLNADFSEIRSLQKVNFLIEPSGTKVYINANYYGRTPFTTELDTGEYIIYAEHEDFDKLRYSLRIDNITDQTADVLFHLSSLDYDKIIKFKHTAYYSLFWTATFSLAVTIPAIVFAKEAFYSFGLTNSSWNNDNPGKLYVETDEGFAYYFGTNFLYGFAAFSIANSVLFLGWMFYALADYLISLEKKDFIPILEFYRSEEGEFSIGFGAEMRL